MAVFRIFLRQPLYQEVKASPPAFRADMMAPSGPVLDQAAEPDEADDLCIGRIFQYPLGCPILIQPTDVFLASKNAEELFLADIIVPYIG
jgi:hypothetical protein